MHINQLARKFPNNKGILTKEYKSMIKEGILVEHKFGNKKILSLSHEHPKPYLAFQHVMSSLPLAEQRADKILKRLEKKKPLFIRSEFKEFEKLPMKINPRCRIDLNQILEIINDLVSRSVALTYAECLDSFPKNSEGEIKKYHKECIRTINIIMDKLEKQHKESDMELSSYLYYGVQGYRFLSSLLFLSKN
ncbi:MAG: hypothetical protein KC483_04765 [Nitrosarchaeum sp.]|nr:hypothetical protein [Nitrosarchaeum sp.]